jgi:hypothetical protein
MSTASCCLILLVPVAVLTLLDLRPAAGATGDPPDVGVIAMIPEDAPMPAGPGSPVEARFIKPIVDLLRFPAMLVTLDESGKLRVEGFLQPESRAEAPRNAIEEAKLAQARAAQDAAVAASGNIPGAVSREKTALVGTDPLLLRPDPAACVLESPPTLQKIGPSDLTEAERSKLRTGGKP